MSEQTFTDRAQWDAACLGAEGLHGPYQISWQPHLWQYVGNMGTAAMWNEQKGMGFIFEQGKTA